jgi:1-acyl-sn-glycerol-3-phosphate acyltransferase
VLVYPGGDWEAHRPSWHANRVEFAGREGFVRLALAARVPIVPVVSIGGQETALFITRGEHIARALRLDRRFRLKVVPISLALPWGIDVGDIFGHIALPAKITIQVLGPIDLRERFGPDPDVDAIYDEITGLMQQTLDKLAAERRWPLIG